MATRLGKNTNFVIDLLKTYQPEITIMHNPRGEKHDHGNSGYLMYLAFKRAISRGIPLGKLWMRPNGWLLEPEAKEMGRVL